ncbi:MAG: hypothetical protein KY437_10545 [Actinobacteria bacterium]|nr:hypothetical protein [Actinomycetota bacterium]
MTLVPAERAPDDPHNGTWFVTTLSPGERDTWSANLVNPTSDEMTVRLSTRDLRFVDGVPTVVQGDDDQTGVGTWASFERAEVTLPPAGTIGVELSVQVPPTGVEPGDHVGVAIAETVTETADATLVQQIATRIYVTVPGEVDRSFVIADVDAVIDSTWWPRSLAITVTVRNDGPIKISPHVTVGGQQARGPRAVLSDSEEMFVAELPAPLVAGNMDLPVVVEDVSGELRQVAADELVVRWGFILAALLVLAAAIAVARWWRGHESRTARLERDIRRLERLVAGLGQAVRGEADAPGGLEGNGDAELALVSALKRARRVGDHEAFARLALASHEASGDALPALLDALEHPDQRREALIAAAASYGRDAIAEDPKTAVLAPDTREELLRAVRAHDGSRETPHA